MEKSEQTFWPTQYLAMKPFLKVRCTELQVKTVLFVSFNVTYTADEKGGHPAGSNPSSQLCDLRQLHPFQASGASSMTGM